MADVVNTTAVQQAAAAQQAAPAKKPKKVSPAMEKLKALVVESYANSWAAKNRGELVGWSTSKFPCEIWAAFDLNVVYPENLAAAVAAQHDGERLCDIAVDYGYDADMCAYERINLAMAHGHDTRATKHFPQPDFVVSCNNGCNCFTKWYETLARIRDIPMVYLDIPYHNTTGLDEGEVKFVREQFDICIHQLEEITGKKFDEKKFEEACAVANRNSHLWSEVCKMCEYKPSPMNGFDLFTYMANMIVMRCDPRVGEVFEELLVELHENVKKGESNLPYKEEYRIMMEGIPCWGNLRDLFKPLKKYGMNVTAVVYAPAFGFEYSNLDEMAQSYARTAGAVCLEEGTEWRRQLCVDNKVDGILVHYNRSCKAWSGYMAEMQRRWEKELGIPCVGFDGDQADARVFNAANYETKAQGLAEAMAANKAKKEAEANA